MKLLIAEDLPKPRKRVKAIDCVGKQFNRLTVVSIAATRGQVTTAECLCTCGNTVYVGLACVVHGNTKSCGCLKHEVTVLRNTKHGMARTKIYAIWSDMVGRCRRPSHHAYGRYGGRGITVDASWLKFETFFADMGERPEGRSLDRIDNNGPYSKENCRWATVAQQNINTRTSTNITLEGVTFGVSTWASLLRVGKKKVRRVREMIINDGVAPELAMLTIMPQCALEHLVEKYQ